MKLSIYTFVKDGLYFDFHVTAMLKHHLPLADEIIVNEGYSTDGTYEAIKDLDPKIRISRNHWDRSDPATWHIKFKNHAREMCTGDWCILLDCDEFIPEWEFASLRDKLQNASHSVFKADYKNFYGNYKVYLAHNPRLKYKYIIHRNLPEMEIWGDGSNVRLKGASMTDTTVYGDAFFEVHHFGEVRNPARLRHKWHIQARQHRNQNPFWSKMPNFLFNLFPHRWDDPDLLPTLGVYDGPFIQAVQDDPQEFVRDKLYLYKRLKKA